MNTPPDDSVLHAWLDDELAADRRAEVEHWLRDHPEEAARVRLWAADAEALRAALNPVLDETVPDRLARVVWQRERSFLPQGWQRIAAALAVFALGGAVGAGIMWRGQAGKAPAVAAAGNGESVAIPWVRRAAVAHSVYVPEVRHPVEVAVAQATPAESRAQEEHLARWLGKRLGMPVLLADLRPLGFELVGGRLLPDGNGPSAQLMYQQVGKPAEGAQPVRVTVYLRKPDAAQEVAFRYEQQGELGMFYWVEGATATSGPIGCALVGALPRARLLELAEAVYKQLEAAQTKG